MSRIGLFPLPLVLLPGELLPLHIFEPRYRELISECIEAERNFGIVLQDRSGMRTVGTQATVIEVLERLPDGRLNILVEGRTRFRVVEVHRKRSFATADIEDVPDDPAPPDGETVDRCVEAFERLAKVTGAQAPPVRGERTVSYRIAVQLGLAPQFRQELLEQVSEQARLTRLIELIESALETAEIRATAMRRAPGNGLVDHL